MTFSLLARDPGTGTLCAAAATGSLCVGGWVLRGRLDAGLSASQGAAPSTFWGEDVLDRMAGGQGASTAVAEVTGADRGRAWRQLAALDPTGRAAAFTGEENTPQMGARSFPGGIASGNMLAGLEVLDALSEAFQGAGGSPAERLIAALRAADRAGSDSRGLFSAALLVLSPAHAPLTLRIDYHDSDPIGALQTLHARATSGGYGRWARQVPCAEDPERILSETDFRD